MFLNNLLEQELFYFLLKKKIPKIRLIIYCLTIVNSQGGWRNV